MNIKIIALTALVCAAGGAQALVITGLATSVDGVGFNHQLLLGTIEGKANSRILIEKIAIGGDADFASGKQAFQIQGGGVDFTFGAGGDSNPPFALNYVLDPTQETNANGGRSFSYMDMTAAGQQAQVGQAVKVYWRGTADWDGNYTFANDIYGTPFDDSAVRSSARAWVQYSYQVVPEPAALAGIVVGIAGLVRRRKK